jgi:hypothetical protein
VHQATDDLQLAAHAAGKGAHRLLDIVGDAQQRGEAAHLLAIRGRHEAVAGRIGIEPVEQRVEAHVLLGSEIHVQAWALEDDPDDPAHRTRLPNDVPPVDRRRPASWRERRREDRDRGGLAGTVGSKQGEELAGAHVE